MAYIKLEDLQKFPIRIDHYDKENGNESFVLGIESVIEYAENLPTADVVETDKVAEMFAEQFGDTCPCNFNDNDEWLTLYCKYTNTCDCPCKEGWKEFVKHYGERRDT